MRTTKNITFNYTEYDRPEELDDEDRGLLLAAREAALNAYSPYSLFKVGAAIRLESGLIVKGANVENAAYPSGICAERNALSNSVTNHPNDKPVAIAIAALSENGLTESPVPPCGNCRQVLAEEELRNNRQIRIILSGKNKIQVVESCTQLLPLQFTKNNLLINFH
jgi:cytidine deaminase